MKKLKYLIFDLDNTLIHSDVIYERALKSIAVDQSGSAFQKARTLVKTQLPPLHTSARNRLLYFKSMRETEKDFSAFEVLHMMELYENSLFRETLDQVKALNRHVLFQELCRQGFQLGIISNENLRTQLIKLKALDERGAFFKSCLFSEEVGVEKPNPFIFESFFARSGWSPEEAVFIGDDEEADILGASHFNMKTIKTWEFCNSATPRETKASMQIEKLTDLLQLFAKN